MDKSSATYLTTIQKPEYVGRRLQEIGFWFVDIPRTSSTALRLAFYRRFGKLFGKPSNSQGLGMGLIPPHVPASDIRSQVGPDLWDSLYTFSLVRNPFDRLLSLYHFLRANGKLTNQSFPQYVARVSQGGFDYHGHSKSNLGYLTDDQGRVLVNDVFRFEDSEAAMTIIAARTGCPEILAEGTRVCATSADHYSHYYDEATRGLVERMFQDDLDHFGYRFEVVDR